MVATVSMTSVVLYVVLVGVVIVGIMAITDLFLARYDDEQQ